MIVTCISCGLEYNDLYCLTLCPHEPFQMNTLVARNGTETRRCRSLEEAEAFMEGIIPPREEADDDTDLL